MNIEAYKNITKQSIQSVEIEGEKHYFKLPSYLDVDLFSLVQDKKLPQAHKMLMCLACIIVDENGKRIFSEKNKEHLDIIKALPNDIQIGLIGKMSDTFFPKKSKAQG